MLRPKDDAVFSGAKLRYIVLDEAHIYEGAEGATAVLGTQLFEQLPSEEMAPPSTDGRLFRQAEIRPVKDRIFLIFSFSFCRRIP